MITLPKLAADALGAFLAADMKDRFGVSHARLTEIIPFVAQLALECIGNSDALYHNVEHTMLVTLAGHDIFKGRALVTDSTPTDSDTKFVTTGLEVRHRFLPEPPPPPAPVVVAAPPPPPMKKKIVLRGVNFDFDKYNIRPDAVPILEEAAKTLKDESQLTVAVNGYTDAIGSAEYNQRLSERRANSVKAYLEQLGVGSGRLTAQGFGKTNPVATNDTAEGRAQNRRVELVVNP